MIANDIKAYICIIGLFFLFFIFIVFNNSQPKLVYTDIRVRVDSVNERLKYDVLPEKHWTFYTRCGNIYANRPLFAVGDSINIKLIKIPK